MWLWLLRCRLLFTIFLTGEVPKISQERVKAMERCWRELEDKERQRELAALKDSSQNRRVSMTENATKGGLVLSALGFVVAIAAFVLPNEGGITLFLAKAGIGLFMFATVITLWMNSPKLKLLKRKLDRTPEGERRLEAAVKRRQTEDPTLSGFDEYLRSANIREKRDMLTFLERRALLSATLLYIVGLLVESIALFLR